MVPSVKNRWGLKSLFEDIIFYVKDLFGYETDMNSYVSDMLSDFPDISIYLSDICKNKKMGQLELELTLMLDNI